MLNLGCDICDDKLASENRQRQGGHGEESLVCIEPPVVASIKEARRFQAKAELAFDM